MGQILRVLSVTAGVLASFAMPIQEARAWNIVCGVSIAWEGECDKGEELLSRQYDVDAKLLKGISEYHSALAALQVVNIDAVKSGKGGNKDKQQIKDGSGALGAAAKSMRSAVGDGQKLLADTAKMKCNFSQSERDVAKDTLARADRFAKHLEQMAKKINSGTLPSVKAMHDGLGMAQRITANGLKLSKAHLGKAHHTGADEEIRVTP